MGYESLNNLSYFITSKIVDYEMCHYLCSSVHGIFKQEYWNELPFPPPRDLPNPWVNSVSPVSTDTFLTRIFILYLLKEHMAYVNIDFITCYSGAYIEKNN